MGKRITNVSFLDLTSASPESLAEISTISNVSLMLYSDKITPMLTHVTMQNISCTLQVPENFKMVNGQFEVDKNYLSGMKEAVFLLINGQLIVEEEVSADDVESGINGLYVNGTILCPEKLKGIVQRKIETNNGKLVTFMDNATLIKGDLHLDESYLRSLEHATRLVVTGNVRLTGAMEVSLLDEKLEKIQFLKQAVIREEYMEVMNRKLAGRDNRPLTVIPKGSVYVDKELHIDSVSIQKYAQAKIYATNKLRFHDDVTEDLLRKHISHLHTADLIIARKELRPALLEVMDDAGAAVLTYSDKLLVIEGEHRLTPTELKYTNGKVTMIVYGELDIDSSIPADTLYEKIEHIDNFGKVISNGEQYGVIQTKLRTNMGDFTDRDAHKEGNDEPVQEAKEEGTDNSNTEVLIANVSYLKL